MFEKFTPSQYFLLGFTLTYVILLIILLVSIYMKTPKIDLARKALHGLIVLSTFVIGYIVGEHVRSAPTEGKRSWSLAETVQAIVGLIVVVLAVTTIISLEKSTPDITSAKRSIKGMGILIFGAVLSTVLQKGKDVKLPTSVFYF
jgi:cytochrome c biogenesis factor